MKNTINFYTIYLHSYILAVLITLIDYYINTVSLYLILEKSMELNEVIDIAFKHSIKVLFIPLIGWIMPFLYCLVNLTYIIPVVFFWTIFFWIYFTDLTINKQRFLTLYFTLWHLLGIWCFILATTY